jgi:hypothetical protein
MFEEILPELQQETAEKGTEGRLVPFTPQPARCCFVDGGNGTVFESATARVEFVRVYGCIYEGKKRVATKKEEGLILLKREQGRIVATGYGISLSLSLPEDDPELQVGREKVSLGSVANLARYLLECNFLGSFGKECTHLVRDGSVVANNRYEQEALDALPKGLCGLSKTHSLSAQITGPGSWVSPLEERDGVLVGMVKLHPESKYTFRLDALELTGVAAALAETAGDPAFPGYPYPLIEADQLGRVSNQEIEQLKMRFAVEAGSAWKELEKQQHATDAHGVLDRIN